MTEFKAGDRVKVEFDGVIEGARDGVGFSVVAPTESAYWIHEEYLTKLHDPLPTKDGAVIRVVAPHTYPRVFELRMVGSWIETGNGSPFDGDDIHELANEYGFTVLYAGDDE